MAFRLIRFRATSPLSILSVCTEGPCASGQEAELEPLVESGDDVRFDVVYAITDGDAGFCHGGDRTLLLRNVVRENIPVTVRLCRGAHLPREESRLRLVVTVTERGGRSASRAAYIEVLPLGAQTSSVDDVV